MYKIMVVDDDEQINEALSLVLKKANYDTILRTSGKNLVQFVKDTCPDAILLDIRLMDEDGLSIAKDLKQDIITKNIPIILISARVGTLTEEQMAGAELYLPKPFRMRTLLAALTSLLPYNSVDTV